jgi:dTDP-4-dehydrorhamnose 3,5-epimerase
MEQANMKIAREFPSGLLLLQPEIYRDDRGFFFESFNQSAFDQIVPGTRFVQDNQSRSSRNVLRGLHYQVRQAQGKLVRVLHGEIFDVAVDLRRNSPTFGSYESLRLSSTHAEMLWIPPGFAHGFYALSESADILYKTTDYYAAAFERTILWNDPDLAIEWPCTDFPHLSAKDARGTAFREADTYDWIYQPPATLPAVCHPA